MQKKKIYILLGHPNSDETFTKHLADAYESGALRGGHQVRRQNVSEMQFDPILHKGYRVVQALEPDLVTFQKNVQWADHFVIVHPRWWGAMPALLKGVFDRAWLSGFAFHFHKDTFGWDPLLHDKTARVLIPANTSPWISRVLFGDFTNELSRATLGFAGIKTKNTVFWPSERASDTVRSRWIRMVDTMGYRAI